jgi:polysaccharide pyruvyl transferase WcaK-like protein
MCALKLGKPVISVGYAGKNVALMADVGVPEFCQNAKQLDVELLMKQFVELEQRSAELAPIVSARCRAKEEQLAEQFGRLSASFLAG